ncbi:MAG: thiamine pyrophosphate-dependent enzyme [Nanopusillaceae archaeon]
MELRKKTNITWCPGCSNYAILSAFIKAIEDLSKENKINPEKLVVVSGIGCASKIVDYLNLSSFNGLHGRALVSAIGIKIANPELSVIVFQGDGDTYNEGLEHFISACKENPDVKLFVHNNQIFALTVGQHTFTTEENFLSKSLGINIFQKPINPILLAISAGATFVARGYALWIDHLSYIFKEAILHKGFAFVDIIQPCITFHDTREYYEKRMYKLEDIKYDPKNLKNAIEKALEFDYNLRENATIPIGIFYRSNRVTLEEGLKSIPFYKITRTPDKNILLDLKI